MTRMYPSRRSVLRTIGGGIALGTMALPASGAGDALADDLNAVRAATREYRDLAVARADGYGAITPYVPGMGFHFANGPPWGETLTDPGVLVYYTNGSYNPDPGDFHDPAHDDDLILGAVEYLVLGNRLTNLPDIFDDENSRRSLKVTEADGWHFHQESSESPSFTALHAWVHRGNPAGVFHNTNPTID